MTGREDEEYNYAQAKLDEIAINAVTKAYSDISAALSNYDVETFSKTLRSILIGMAATVKDGTLSYISDTAERIRLEKIFKREE